jgi:WD40 repeat protein
MNSGKIEYYDSITKALVKYVGHFHVGRITYLKYLSNGCVASASIDMSVNIWDPNTWTLIRKYTEHTKSVYFLDQIDNDTIVTASLDSTLRVWKISTGQTLSKINVPSLAYAVKTLPNGLIACGLYGLTEKNVVIYNLTTPSLVQTLNGHSGTLYSLEMFSNELMVSGSYDTKVTTWNLTTYKSKYNFTGHKDRVFCLKRISSNLVASADRSGLIIIWDWLRVSIVHILTGHTSGLWTSSLDLFDAQILISGSQDKTIKFWNISNGALIQSINVDIQVNALTMLKTGSEFKIKIKNLFCSKIYSEKNVTVMKA